jgi:fatty-acyl-CoA synthase
VRTGDASAFSLPAANGKEDAVLLVQCRNPEQVKHSDLVLRIQGRIRRELGIDCSIQPVPRHTLPRTTSGKLSRSKARKDYIRRTALAQTAHLDSLRADYQELRQAV